MNSPDDLEERMRQLEKEMNFSQGQPPLKRAEPEKVGEDPVSAGINSGKVGLASLIAWVNSLTGPIKVVAVVVLGLVALGILKFVFNLVAEVIFLGLMALVGYVLYKLFLAPTPPPSKL